MKAYERYIRLGLIPNLQAYIEMPRLLRKRMICRAWKIEHPGVNNRLTKTWRERNKERLHQYQITSGRINFRTWSNNLKNRVYDLLGRECSCIGCDVTDMAFLCIDHIIPKKYVRGINSDSREVYREVLAHPDPRSLFRVFCHNCNMATRNYHPCPHSMQEVELFHHVCDRIAQFGFTEKAWQTN